MTAFNNRPPCQFLIIYYCPYTNNPLAAYPVETYKKALELGLSWRIKYKENAHFSIVDHKLTANHH